MSTVVLKIISRKFKRQDKTILKVKGVENLVQVINEMCHR